MKAYIAIEKVKFLVF